jgi:rod shape-determining protein MreD
MTTLPNILILLAVILAVFAGGAFNGLRQLLGAQVDLLPALMVYTALSSGPPMMLTVAVVGGLCFDSLSANPLGTSVLPLLIIGFLLQLRRDLILREQIYAQFVLGLLASAVAPIISILILLTLGYSPLLGWGSLWQWTVMTVGGAVATPVFFVVFSWLNRVLGYQRIIEISFRPDREIQRGRSLK